MSQSLFRWLHSGSTRAALLIRHAERGHFSHPAEGANVPITPQGEIDAATLGRSLAAHGPIDLCHSPVHRCGQTAEAIADGARNAGAVLSMTGCDGRLGGPYLLDVDAALNVAGDLGHRFVREWFDGHLSPTLLKPRRATAMEQIAVANDHLNRIECGLVVMVTHDWNLLAVREELLGLRHEDDRWPGFLDGIVVWQADNQIHVATGDVAMSLPDRDLVPAA